MAISQVRPVPEQYPISGEYLQTTGYWTPARPHLGVDFSCPTGTPITAVTQKARVHAIHRPGDGWGDGSFGICIVMDVVDTPWYYLYAHLSQTKVIVGQWIEPGTTPIALSGATGLVTGPHLHVQACESPDFPRNVEIMGDPILGLRGLPPPVEESDPTLESLQAAHNSLNKVVGEDRLASQAADRALDSRVSALEAVITAMVKAAPKG